MKRQTNLWLVVVAVVGLLAGMTAASWAAPAAPGSDQAVKSSVSAPVVAQASNGASKERIKVHGHWIIEVRNPDGSLAEHREFDNALTSDGAVTLAQLLGRQISVGGWGVTLVGNPSILTGGIVFPFIAESTLPETDPGISNNLTVDVPASGANANKLVLSGTMTAQQNGNISGVRAEVCRLGSNSPPSGAYNFLTRFTLTTLATPVSLTAGQIVQVTVIISFS